MYKLLVVDDEMKIRDVIREYAEFNGYEVSEAEDGMAAVRMCKEEDFDEIKDILHTEFSKKFPKKSSFEI